MQPANESDARDRMIEADTSSGDRDEPRLYEIRIQGHLDHQWADWFGVLTVKREENGDTLLTGTMVDQSALHGLLRKVRDLGLPLISVNRVEPGQADVPDMEP